METVDSFLTPTQASRKICLRKNLQVDFWGVRVGLLRKCPGMVFFFSGYHGAGILRISLRFEKRDDWNKSPTVFPIHSPFKWLWSYHAQIQIQVVDNLHYIRLVKLPIKGYSWLGLLSWKSDSQKQSAPQNQAKSIRGSSFFSKADVKLHLLVS